jgi:hypothetical protein
MTCSWMRMQDVPATKDIDWDTWFYKPGAYHTLAMTCTMPRFALTAGVCREHACVQVCDACDLAAGMPPVKNEYDSSLGKAAEDLARRSA